VHNSGHEFPKRDFVSPAEEASPGGAEVGRVMPVGCINKMEAVAPGMKELV